MNFKDDIEHYVYTFYGATDFNALDGTSTGDFTHPTSAGYDIADRMVSELTNVQVGSYASGNHIFGKAIGYTWPEDFVSKLVAVDDAVRDLSPVASGYRILAGSGITFGEKLAIYSDADAKNKLASFNENIAASPLGDEWGPYLDASGGLTPSVAAGEYFLCVKVAGSVTIRGDVPAAVKFVDDNGDPTHPDENTGRFQAIYSGVAEAGGEPFWAVIKVSVTAVSYITFFVDRVYEAHLVSSDRPVIVP